MKNVQILFLFSLMNIVAINAYGLCYFVEQELREVENEKDVDSKKMLREKEYKLLNKSILCSRIDSQYQALAEQQKKVEIQLSLLYQMSNEEWNKLSRTAHEKNPTANVFNLDSNEVITVLENKISALKGDGRYGGEVCTQLVTAYANLARLACIHLDDYPQNKNILKERLEMLSLGMCENELWREQKCTVIVTEARKQLTNLLGLEDESVTVGTQAESPEDMYRGIRDLCDNDRSIDWGAKAYTLSTLSQGLKKRCILQQQAGGDVRLCDDLPRKLYAMFYKQNDSH